MVGRRRDSASRHLWEAKRITEVPVKWSAHRRANHTHMASTPFTFPLRVDDNLSLTVYVSKPCEDGRTRIVYGSGNTRKTVACWFSGQEADAEELVRNNKHFGALCEMLRQRLSDNHTRGLGRPRRERFAHSGLRLAPFHAGSHPQSTRGAKARECAWAHRPLSDPWLRSRRSRVPRQRGSRLGTKRGSRRTRESCWQRRAARTCCAGPQMPPWTL